MNVSKVPVEPTITLKLAVVSAIQSGNADIAFIHGPTTPPVSVCAK
jgi:hypothetical protein